jgi:hypothetical protein
MRWVAALWVLAMASRAHADEVDDLVARGEALAKKGEFTTAIEAFKAADAKRPRAKHSCLIGLAYTRRELWPQAEIFFRACKARASDADPLPKWFDAAQRQLVDKLTAGGAAAITIDVTPFDSNPSVTVSSFAPDEAFSPQTIHLAPGRYTIEASAAGYLPTPHEVTVTDAAPQNVTIELRTTNEASAPAVPSVPRPPPLRIDEISLERPWHASKVPYVVMAGGLALGVVGGLYDAISFNAARNRLANALDTARYDQNVSLFDTRRDITIALYSGAAVAVAVGLVLRYKVFPRERPSVAIGAAPAPHGGFLTLEWTR